MAVNLIFAGAVFTQEQVNAMLVISGILVVIATVVIVKMVRFFIGKWKQQRQAE